MSDEKRRQANDCAKDEVLWRRLGGLTAYETALEDMQQTVAGIIAGEAPQQVWLLQHPPLYTRGTSAIDSDLLAPERFPVYEAGRGGQYTYHGPGQRVAYVMLDLNRRGRDVRAFVQTLERWLITALAELGVVGETRDGRVGVWVSRPDVAPLREDKIAAIGIRVRRWVSFHGVALNVSPELEHYSGITPCGVSEHGVTSLRDLGEKADMDEVDDALRRQFENCFGLRTFKSPIQA